MKKLILATMFLLAIVGMAKAEPYLYDPAFLPNGIEHEMGPNLWQRFKQTTDAQTGHRVDIAVSQPYKWINGKVQPQTCVSVDEMTGDRDCTPCPLQNRTLN